MTSLARSCPPINFCPFNHSVKKLSAKKVGLAGFEDAAHVLARIILTRDAVDSEKEVQFVPFVPDPGRFAGLQQKLADALVTSPAVGFE